MLKTLALVDEIAEADSRVEASAGDQAPRAGMFAAHVLEAGETMCRIQPDDGGEALTAPLAAGCLIAPEAGDVVLCAGTASGAGIYLLSVLSRAKPDTPSVLRARAGLTVETADGPLTLRGGDTLTLSAQAMDVRASAGRFRIASAVVDADAVMSRIGSLQMMGERLLSLVKVISGKHARASRQVEELDQVQAGEVAVTADRVITQRAHYIVHNSTEDMRFDGARIHMG